MRGIASIEISAIVNELKEKFADSYFKNFYELGEGAFLLVLNRERKPFSVYINLTKAINETEFREKAEEPTAFALAVRKKLEGCRIKGLAQHGSDRIVVVDFEGREERRMIIEMFDKGNLLLVNKEGVIEMAYAGRSFRDRSVRRGAVYAFPESGAIPLGDAGAEKVEEIVNGVKSSDQKLITALSKRLNIGPMYLEDAIVKAGLKAGAAARDQGIDEKKLSREIIRIIGAAKRPEPREYLKGDANVDFAIAAIGKYEANPEITVKAFGTVSALLDSIYVKERSTGIDLEKSREIEELKGSIEKQKAQIEAMRSNTEEYKQIANKIFERMGEINELIGEIRKRKAKTVEEMGRKFGNINLKGIDAKRKTVKVELE